MAESHRVAACIDSNTQQQLIELGLGKVDTGFWEGKGTFLGKPELLNQFCNYLVPVGGLGSESLKYCFDSLDKLVSGGPLQWLHAWLLKRRHECRANLFSSAAIGGTSEVVRKLLPAHLPTPP